MDEDKMKRVLRNQRYMPYFALFVTICGAIGCFKHLVRLHEWHALVFMGAKYVVLFPIMGLLWRYYQEENLAVRYVASVGLSGLALISVFSDLATGVLNQ